MSFEQALPFDVRESKPAFAPLSESMPGSPQELRQKRMIPMVISPVTKAVHDGSKKVSAQTTVRNARNADRTRLPR
jgi:hypothetical protein